MKVCRGQQFGAPKIPPKFSSETARVLWQYEVFPHLVESPRSIWWNSRKCFSRRLETYGDLPAAIFIAADTAVTREYVRRVTRISGAGKKLQHIVDVNEGQISSIGGKRHLRGFRLRMDNFPLFRPSSSRKQLFHCSPSALSYKLWLCHRRTLNLGILIFLCLTLSGSWCSYHAQGSRSV